MKIEHMGIRITDVPAFEYIEVQPSGTFALKLDDSQFVRLLTVAETAQLRNALDAALEQHAKFDTAMTTPNTEQPPYAVGQVLTGAENLPLGATVRDGDDSTWHHIKPGKYSMNSTNTDPKWTLAEIVDNYDSATIASLP